MQESIMKSLHEQGIETTSGDPKIIAEYERSMREECIPAIDAALREQARLAHFFRLGIPAPKREAS